MACSTCGKKTPKTVTNGGASKKLLTQIFGVKPAKKGGLKTVVKKGPVTIKGGVFGIK